MREHSNDHDWSIWTFEYLEKLVRAENFENRHVDFKEVLNSREQGSSAHIDSIRRTACGMSNGTGGWIVFGVLDSAKASNANRLVGIPLSGELNADFGRKLETIEPSIYFESIPKPISIPDNETHGVYVIRVPQSQARPHIETNKGVFHIRGDGGTVTPMRLSEVREQMLFGEERRRRITLFRILLISFRSDAKRLSSADKAMVSNPTRFNVAAYNALLPDIVGMLTSEAGLFDRLLDIASAAARVNLVLDRALNLQTGTGWSVAAAQSALSDIEQYGEMCLARIEELVGPI